MSSTRENPGIPLVGLNGKLKKYKTLENELGDSPPGRFETVGSRLARRKELFVKRKRSSDVALIFALFGILLMVTQTELTAAKVYHRSSLPSHLMKMAITASTVALLIFLGIYHRLDIQLFIVNNCVDDWRIPLTARRIIQITFEFIVCSIHPIPGDFDTTWPATVAEGEHHRKLRVPLDTILALPMFLRLFLVCRFIMLHSKLYEDASSQSLGALNRIHFNFRFIFKSLMTMYPDYVLTIIMIVSFVIASWVLRLCEMSDTADESVHANLLNTMWLVAITFLSVGYGDIKPSTYCGRGIAVITGMMGAGCTALVVAVLARKLELSRSEKYVHDFVLDVNLDKRLKNEAANVMKSGWFIYKFRKLKANSSMALSYQTKLLEAIYNIRQIKAAQRRLVDASITMTEVNKTQNEASRSIEIIRCKQLTLEEKVDNLESKIMSLHDKINAILKHLKE